MHADTSMRRGPLLVWLMLGVVALAPRHVLAQEKDGGGTGHDTNELTDDDFAVDSSGGGGNSGGDSGDDGGGGDDAHGTDELTDDDFAVGGDDGGGSGELSDADFGTVTPEIDTSIPETHAFPWLDLSFGIAASSRRFKFVPAIDAAVDSPPGLETGFEPTPTLDLELYPLAKKSAGKLRGGFGFFGGVSKTLVPAPTIPNERRLAAGLVFRLPIARDIPSAPIFKFLAGYLDYTLDMDESSELPDVAYRAAMAGFGFRLPMFNRRLAVDLDGRYYTAFAGGEITRVQNYGRSRIAGLQVGLSFELRVIRFFYMRLAGRFSRMGFDFKGNGAMGGAGAIGANDDHLVITLFSGIAL